MSTERKRIKLDVEADGKGLYLFGKATDGHKCGPDCAPAIDRHLIDTGMYPTRWARFIMKLMDLHLDGTP